MCVLKIGIGLTFSIQGYLKIGDKDTPVLFLGIRWKCIVQRCGTLNTIKIQGVYYIRVEYICHMRVKIDFSILVFIIRMYNRRSLLSPSYRDKIFDANAFVSCILEFFFSSTKREIIGETIRPVCAHWGRNIIQILLRINEQENACCFCESKPFGSLPIYLAQKKTTQK